MPIVEVEISSNEAEHRRRVEDRLRDDAAGRPTWQQVVDRDYHPWPTASVVIDTAVRTPAMAASELRAVTGR